MTQSAPIERIYNLAELSEAGYETVIAPDAAHLAMLAKFAGVEAVTAFEAKIELRRLSQNRFTYEAELTAEIVQSCVVTLEPVRTHIERAFHRALHLVQAAHGRVPKEAIISPASAADDEPEDIDSTRYDLAAPLLEEFVLAIDPYPRAPGVAFETQDEPGARPESPFAVLKKLKGGS